MKKFITKTFITITLAILPATTLLSQDIQLKIYSEEIEEVTASPEKQYLFIGEELTEIKSIVMHIQNLVEFEDPASALSHLLQRYKRGLKTAPQELVIAVLEETEKLIENKHEAFDDAQIRIIAEKFAKCCEQIENGELRISIKPAAIATRSPRDPRAPGGALGAAPSEGGTLVSNNQFVQDLFVPNDLTVGGNMDIHGDTHYTGNVDIDGTLTVGSETRLTGTVYPIASIEAGPSNILNIGITDNTDILNLGIATTDQTINIGTGSATKTVNIGTEGTTTINLGNAGDTINIVGTTTHTGNVEVVGTLDISGTTTIDGVLHPEGGIEADPTGTGILNIGVTDDTNFINIGTGTTTTQINIGGDGDTVNIYGNVNYIGVDNLDVKDKNITINKGGGTADFAGINIEEGVNPAAGYIRTTDNRSGFDLKAPASTNKVTIMPENTDASMQILASNNDRIITERTGNNMFVGRNSGNLAFNPALATGNYGFGYETLKNLTSGDDNIGIGHTALANVREGSNNIGIGVEAGNNIRAGFSNIAIGQRALQTVTTGIFNTAIGAGALQKTIGSNNSAFGSSALINLTSGGENTGVGNGALLGLTTAERNTALGYRAGASSTTGSNNIYIGARQLGVAAETGVIRIGVHDDLNASVSTACYIEGITGQAIEPTANLALIDANSKLGTSAATSATITTPEIIIDNTGGEEAKITLHAEIDIPTEYSTTWKISAEANETADLELTQNTTTRLTFNKKGMLLHSMDVSTNSVDEHRIMSGKTPIISTSWPSYCPHISYGIVDSDGDKISGTNDWESSYLADTNRYLINFSPYFLTEPAITITAQAGFGPSAIAIPEVITSDRHCYIYFRNPSTGTLYTSRFYFIAIE